MPVKVEKSLMTRYLPLFALNRQVVRKNVRWRSNAVYLMQAKRAMGLDCFGVRPGRGVHCMRVIWRNGLRTLGGADFYAFCTSYTGKCKGMVQSKSQCKQHSHQHRPPHCAGAA